MAAKTKGKKDAKKTSSRAKKPSTAKAVKPVKQAKAVERPRIKAGDRAKTKCCAHCQDYEFCQDKGFCCEYCDFLVKGKCNYGKKRKLSSADKENIEIGDYRGDDYGIDDYEAYEDLYE